MSSELEVLITELEARILKLEQDQAERESKKIANSRLDASR
jgi:hypothetical protein